MKIDHTEKIPGMVPRSPKQGPNKADGQQFKDVFSQSIKQSDERRAEGSCVPLSAVSPVKGTSLNAEGSAVSVASDLLGAMERYQKLLSDPSINLKMLAPSVKEIEHAATEAYAAMSHVDEENPVKSVVKDAIRMIHQEVGRFHSGQYIDD